MAAHDCLGPPVRSRREVSDDSGHGFLNPEDYTMKAFRRAIVLDKPADGLRAPDRGGGR